jgi:hypothetical protein
VLAVLVAAALAGAGAAAGAQEAPTNDAATATTVPDASTPDSSAPASSAPDSSAPASSAPASSAPDSSAPDTSAADAAAGDAAADPNGNINNLPLNSGVQTGTVFNPVPYGEVPGNTPQVLVLRPGSGRIIPLNREINIRARFSNFKPGFFSDPASQYGQGTQRLDGNGNLQGHNHACVQRVARDGSVPGERCASFVVMQQEGDSDILTGVGPPLTEAGRYRLCVDAAAENHYPAARAFAQRGGPVDCVRVLAMDFGRLGQPPANANQ